MNCLPELTYAVYLDGELPYEEARAVEMHLEVCPACGELVDALRSENYVLTEALREMEPLTEFSGCSLWWKAAALAPVAAGLNLALNWLAGTQQSGPLGWLNPFTRTGQISWLFNALFWLIGKGDEMLTAMVTNTLAWTLVALVTSGAVMLARRRSVIFPVLLLAFAVSRPSLAVERRTGQPTLRIPASETVNETLLAGGETVEIDGAIDGDLIAGARHVAVRGAIKGDLICWAQSVDVTGSVEGNLYVFAQSLTVHGHVGHNTYAFVQSVRVEAEGRVDGDLTAFAGEVVNDGSVGHSVSSWSGHTDVRGTIGRNLTFGGGNLTLIAPARVGGNLTTYVDKQSDVHIDSEVTIGGKTETHLAERPKSRFVLPWFYFWTVTKLLGGLLVGWIALMFAPGFFLATARAIDSLGRSMGLGFAVLVGAPFAIVLIGITLVGLPVALMGLALYLVALYMAHILVGAWVGRGLLRSPAITMRDSLLALLVGLLVLTVAFELPFGIGVLVRALVLCLGLGAFSYQLYRSARPQREGVA